MAFPYTADLGVFANWRTTFSLSVDSANMLFDISATSSGREFSLGQASGGRCSTHNMRLIIYVCRDTNGKSNFFYDAIFFSSLFQTQGRPLYPRLSHSSPGQFALIEWAEEAWSRQARCDVRGDVTHIRAFRGWIGTRLTLIITWFHVLVTLNSRRLCTSWWYFSYFNFL